MMAKRLGFIGAGNMASALIGGVLGKGTLPGRIQASDPDPARRIELEQRFGVSSSPESGPVCAFAEVLVLAVKPQVVDVVLHALAPHFRADQLVISVCAGVTSGRIQEALGGGARVVRAMPNTPALVGAGATAFALGGSAGRADADFARALFECVGACVEVEERLLDAVTGLSGSGPAYVLMAIEALADGGVQVGLPRNVAHTLALQTVLGTAQLALQTGEHPAVLRDRVTSPGGTTIRGVRALERAGFRHALIDAVQEATERSLELGRPAASRR